MGKSIITERERISKIANQKILVAEDSSVYSIFNQRRVMCRNFNQIGSENHENFINQLEQYDNLIKEYFNI